jgi:3-oxoadipate enol-lactonase
VPQKYARVDGVATFIHHVGPTTLPERPPVLARGETLVCLHGASGNGAVFTELLAGLEAEHSPLAFDRPGHARSGGLESLASIARMAEFTRDFCAALDIDRAVLLGSSQGGCIALETALLAPSLVKALVLVGAGAHCEVPDATLDRLRLVSEGKARREFNRAEYSAHATPDVMRRGFLEDLKTDPRVVYGNAQTLRDWDRTADLGRITCPTLVVVGEDDTEMRAGSDRLASGIPGARQVVVPKAGHGVAREQPEALAEAVRAFLSGLSR